MDSKSSLVPLTLSASATFSKPGKRTRVMVRTFSFRLLVFTFFLYLSLVKNKNKQKSIKVLDCTVRSVSLHAVPYPNSRYLCPKKIFHQKIKWKILPKMFEFTLKNHLFPKKPIFFSVEFMLIKKKNLSVTKYLHPEASYKNY